MRIFFLGIYKPQARLHRMFTRKHFFGKPQKSEGGCLGRTRPLMCLLSYGSPQSAATT